MKYIIPVIFGLIAVVIYLLKTRHDQKKIREDIEMRKRASQCPYFIDPKMNEWVGNRPVRVFSEERVDKE